MSADMAAPDHGARKPDFLIIGAQKSGTTSVHSQLRRYQEIFLPRVKELHFFDDGKRFESAEGLGEYLACFRDARDDQVVGEATPGYLHNRLAARRISETVPEARMVAILRHPVDRAYSAYRHGQRVGAIPRRMSFEAAIDRDTRESGRPWTELLWSGCYAAHLERFGRYFPREQLHVESFEDLVRDPEAVLGRVTRFILRGRAPGHPEITAGLPHANRGAASRAPRLSTPILRRYRPGHPAYRLTARLLLSYDPQPPMDPRTRERLLELYRPWNDQLWELLDQSWEAWAE